MSSEKCTMVSKRKKYAQEYKAEALELVVSSGRPVAEIARDLGLDNGILPSAGKTGICFDNAAAESFNATLKKELIHLHVWTSIKQVKSAIFEYAETYHNRARIQRELGYLSPYEYESGHRIDAALAA
ncbi:IS3 family transposase [Streptacidiphilus cavernicola]|uniref:IS3 family transposase n=1 Tax=Streptacidiphilus cavernicola TaxID=3342716 RepID=A0ABV6W2J5_9ACTN